MGNMRGSPLFQFPAPCALSHSYCLIPNLSNPNFPLFNSPIIVYNGRTQYNMEVYIMAKYICDACGWEYDEELGSPENGIAPGTKFADLPDDFECPLCGVGKDMFSEA